MARGFAADLLAKEDCPCGSDLTYATCCGRLHRGQARAETAEQLMRSRYSAFARGEIAYLMATNPDALTPQRSGAVSSRPVAARPVGRV